MYSNEPDYQKFPPTAMPPPPSAPPHTYDQSTMATGIPVNSTNQYSGHNPNPYPAMKQHPVNSTNQNSVHNPNPHPAIKQHPVNSTNQNSVHNPNSYSVMPPHMHQQHPGIQVSAWTTGLCDCAQDVPNCCITFWCPCVTFGLISEIIDRGTSSCVLNGSIYTLIAWFTGCACIYSCFYRSKLRAQYTLEEGACPDFLVHFCCETCALCQEYRELKNRGFNVDIGWQANMDLQNQGVGMAPMVHPGMTR